MRSTALCRFSLMALLATSAQLLFAQTPSTQTRSMPGPLGNTTGLRLQVSEPAVPRDPLELVTGDAQPVETADQRATVTQMLFQAFSLSNVRAFPYDRKTAFTSLGSASSEGNWQLEDISPGEDFYRWSAQGPSYSVVNLFNNRMLYSDQPGAAIPLRLAQVRSAMFFLRPVVGPRATLRTASSNFNGISLECILLSHMGAAKGVVGGRHWNESEYCVDTASGTLITLSLAPGLYVLYDYSQAIHFHDRVVPNKFTITEAGRTVIEAQTTSVSDPPTNNSLFQPSGLSQVGVGALMTAPWNFPNSVPSAAVPSGSAQVVVVHGMQSPSGQVTDTEVIASSDSTLDSAALNVAAKWQQRAPDDAEPGTTPQSHEILVTITFLGTGH